MNELHELQYVEGLGGTSLPVSVARVVNLVRKTKHN